MCVWSHLNLSLALFISQYSSIVNTPCGLDFSWVWFTFLDHYGSLATLAVVTRESALCYILFKYEHQALCLIDLKERHIVKSKSDSVSVAREMTLAVWNIYLSCPLFCRIPLARMLLMDEQVYLARLCIGVCKWWMHGRSHICISDHSFHLWTLHCFQIILS